MLLYETLNSKAASSLALHSKRLDAPDLYPIAQKLDRALP